MYYIKMHDLKKKLPIVMGEPEWCLMAHTIINYLTTIILSILFPLARRATIEMPSNSTPKFPIATGKLATAKRIPCNAGVESGRGVVVVSAYMDGTRGLGMLSSAGDVLDMSVV